MHIEFTRIPSHNGIETYAGDGDKRPDIPFLGGAPLSFIYSRKFSFAHARIAQSRSHYKLRRRIHAFLSFALTGVYRSTFIDCWNCLTIREKRHVPTIFHPDNLSR